MIARFTALLPRRSDYAGLSRSWRADIVAGLTVGVVALPLALAFGITTGLGAEAGLITAIVAGFVAAVFGGSNVQVSGPTGAMTVVLVLIVARYGRDSGLRGRPNRRRVRGRRGARSPRALPGLHAVAGDRGLHCWHRHHHLLAASPPRRSVCRSRRARTPPRSRCGPSARRCGVKATGRRCCSCCWSRSIMVGAVRLHRALPALVVGGGRRLGARRRHRHDAHRASAHLPVGSSCACTAEPRRTATR